MPRPHLFRDLSGDPPAEAPPAEAPPAEAPPAREQPASATRGTRRISPLTGLLLAPAVAACVLGAVSCRDGQDAPPNASQGPHHASPSPAPGPSSRAPRGPTDAPRTHLLEADVENAPLIGAMFMATPIMSDMDWPPKDRERRRSRAKQPLDSNRVMRLGYLRQGQKVPVFPEAHRKPNCAEGWYELVAGGFVCGKYATLDLNHPRVRLAPHPPSLTTALPYGYGTNVADGTPLYYSVPTKDDRARFEPWLAPRPKPRVDEDSNPYPDPDDTPSATLAKTAGMAGMGSETEDAGVPWYLRERDRDAGKPQITLDELKGEGGPIVRRMVRGFILALDSQVKVKNVFWWRTTYGHVVAKDKIVVHQPPTDFHGIWLNKPQPPPFPLPLRDADGGVGPGSPVATLLGLSFAVPPAVTAAPFAALTPPGADAAAPAQPTYSLPVAFVTAAKGGRYTMSPDRSYVTRGENLPWHTALPLTGQTAKVGGSVFEETVHGFWVRASDVRRMQPGPPPKDLAPGEKWVDVNLTTQSLVAFEGDTPVYATLISSGKKDDNDKEKDHRTPTGSFRIREKHISATMDGDVASDGPYSIEDVPWIMYFQGSYALHGAFWHNAFGRERSHGCVNMAPADARALFFWSDPPLPDNWHGVAATESRPGTRVIVHE